MSDDNSGHPKDAGQRGGSRAGVARAERGGEPDRTETIALSLPVATLRELERVAAHRGASVPAVIEETLQAALPLPGASPAGVARHGYRWKDVFLPEDTELCFRHKGQTYVAVVAAGRILHDGQAVSPSQFINAVAGPGRNAWIGIWVRRPTDARWLLADDLRRAAEVAFIAGQALAMQQNQAAGPPRAGANRSGAGYPEAMPESALDMLGRVAAALGYGAPPGSTGAIPAPMLPLLRRARRRRKGGPDPFSAARGAFGEDTTGLESGGAHRTGEVSDRK